MPPLARALLRSFGFGLLLLLPLATAPPPPMIGVPFAPLALTRDKKERRREMSQKDRASRPAVENPSTVRRSQWRPICGGLK